MSEDLKVAKERLKEKKLRLVIVKGGVVLFESKDAGVRTLLEAIDKLGRHLEGSAVADTIIGKAAALLCLYGKVSSIYARLISETALKVLQEKGLSFEYEKMTPVIFNREHSDICPFEKLIQNIDDREEAYGMIKALSEKL